MKNVTEAKALLKEQGYTTKLSREDASKALGVSKATLHRLRGQGRIKAVEAVLNGHKSITYNRDDVAILLFKRSV